MDTSFELLSSMSPKITKYVKPPKRPPTKLALKKYFRRSSMLSMPNKLNESVVSISSSNNSNNESDNNEPVIISDSDSDKVPIIEQKVSRINETKTLADEKYNKIKLWVDEVNSAKRNISVFSTVSTVFGDGDGLKYPDKNVAVSSTFLGPSSRRLDQLFDKKTEKNEQIRNESLISEDLSVEDQITEQLQINNMTLDDSLELNLDDSLGTRFQMKENKNIGKDNEECESLLDSIYGDSWRVKRAEILPLSNPCEKKKVNKIKVPNTEKQARTANRPGYFIEKQDNNLLKLVQEARFKRALESPWRTTLKKVCDSDTESDEDEVPKRKLNFDDLEDDIIKVPIKSTKKNISTNKQTQKTDSILSYSFLASLSAIVPMSKCDMSALIYRDNFKQNKEELAQKLFSLYNEKIFDNSVLSDTAVIWNDRMRRTAGFCRCKKIIRRTGVTERRVQIELSTKVIDSADRLRDTLVHEMCHAATWIVNEVSDGHGSFWKSWADKAMRVFPELPPIKRCHQYVINTKYTYRCEGCGYCIGRHSKSLDTDRKRCGYCYGKFEVLINKISKKGETKTMPATPKKATAFALFVKENYATHKTPDLKHAEIMKLLGQKFSELKCQQNQ